MNENSFHSRFSYKKSPQQQKRKKSMVEEIHRSKHFHAAASLAKSAKGCKTKFADKRVRSLTQKFYPGSGTVTIILPRVIVKVYYKKGM